MTRLIIAIFLAGLALAQTPPVGKPAPPRPPVLALWEWVPEMM